MMRMNVENQWVRSFEMNRGKPRAFLATNQQLSDMRKFLCNESFDVVLGFDLTFERGPFYLTPTT